MAEVARSPKQMGNMIQRERRRKGLTQTELANLSGLRQELISRIESGHEGTKLSSLYALFAALDLDLVVDSRSKGSRTEIQDIF